MRKTRKQKRRTHRTRGRGKTWKMKGGTTPYVFTTKEQLKTAVKKYYTQKKSAIKIYGPIETWDVSQITDMSRLFADLENFNEDISNWNVSNVTNMHATFYNATSFNKPLNSWNVYNVTDMSNMFHNATAFNQPLNLWNVSNVTDMQYMFYQTHKFNQPLNSWNVSNVTNMRYMFAYASKFNQPLNDWDVKNVTDMSFMFSYAYSFKQPLYKWNVSNNTNIRYMFMAATKYNNCTNPKNKHYVLQFLNDIALNLFVIPDNISDDMLKTIFDRPIMGRIIKQRQIDLIKIIESKQSVNESIKIHGLCKEKPELCQLQPHIFSFLKPKEESTQYTKTLLKQEKSRQDKYHSQTRQIK